MKKKENRNAVSNPNLSYPYISPAYHYTKTPTRQNSEALKVALALSITFNVNST